ncbi:VTT domain-containing protein [Azospira restricta]|uniref:VTT domain-containing protein n=1 Tax=Azospira restricta TaxID=404405 RepID=A0A974SLY7_9RHOO|nr:VTT domain-containing protein [Azospira restricta]QRJ62606.1 VTT domain-containing protein [Azospira restricta]
MDLTQISDTLQRDAVWVVFLNVLLQQLGLPVPAVPTLLLAGSLAAGGGDAGRMLAAAVLASVIADWVWYLAGRGFGYRVLSGLCKLSINPGSCVSDTEARFVKWGVWSLVVAKFVPGFSTVAPPIAGSLRMPLPGFLAAAAIGAALWAGSAIGTGWVLRAEVHAAIAAMSEHGGRVVGALTLALAVWIGWKLWQKYRFERLAAIPAITPDELLDALASERPPRLVDLRGPVMIASTAPVDGAVVATLDTLSEVATDWPRQAPVVTLCACPQDATAISAAHQLTRMGFRSARPLRGGYEAWLAMTKGDAGA